MYTYSWFILLYNGNWYSSVKHLYFNLKNTKENKIDCGDDYIYLWNKKQTNKQTLNYTLWMDAFCGMVHELWYKKTLRNK